MRAQQIAKAIRAARVRSGSTQREMAERVGVSARLWAEVERGERPNVSLETALRMLASVGLHVHVVAPPSRKILSSENDARRERAALRRATWTGGRARLQDEADPSVEELSVAERLGAVSTVSQFAYALAADAAPRVKKVAESPPLAAGRRRRRA